MPASHPIRAWLRTRARPTVALAAAIGLTAQGGHGLAVLAGWHPILAWLLPAATDVYALAAFHSGRRGDRAGAILLMTASGSLYHLAHTGHITVGAPLVIAVAALPVVVLWRVHALADDHEPTTVEPAVPEPPQVEEELPPAPAPVALPSPPVPLPPAWPASPAGRKCLPLRCAASASPRTHRKPAERKRKTTRPTGTAPARKRTTRKRGPGRPVTETIALADEIHRKHPTWTRKQIAAALDISDRALRLAYQEARGISVA